MNEAGTGEVFLTNTAARWLGLGLALLFLFVGTVTASTGASGLVVGVPIAVVAAFVCLRLRRFGLEATSTGITIRNLGRTYALPWSEVSDVRVGATSNATGLVVGLIVDRTQGQPIEAMGTASYSRRKVESMLSRVREVRPSA